MASEATYILPNVIFALVILLGGLRMGGCICFVSILSSPAPTSIPNKSYNLFQNSAEPCFRQGSKQLSMGLRKPLLEEPELLSNSSGLMCHVRQNKFSLAVIWDEQQKCLVTKDPDFVIADWFFLLLLPQEHSKGPVSCQVGGKEPTNTGPARPSACLFCNGVVSNVLTAVLERPVTKRATYCIACYFFAHIMEPGSNRVSSEGLFLAGRALPGDILLLKSQGSPISDTARVAPRADAEPV